MASSTAAIAAPSPALLDGRSSRPQAAEAVPPQCISLPQLYPSRRNRLGSHESRKQMLCATGQGIARNTITMETGDLESSTETGTDISALTKPIQEAWEKVEDKYAVAALTAAALLTLWASTGLISAIDRLPLVPGVLELVGIGCTGWFMYQNIIFKPDREALFDKIKDSYNEIIGSK